MKVCPICQQKYSDENQNFCLADGGILTVLKDDPPPTVIMNQPRQTNPNWSNYEPPKYQNQQIAQPNQSFGMQGQMGHLPVQGQNQTFPMVSLVLGIFGILLSLCCYLGIPLGLAGAIMGYIGMKNANENPVAYGGKNIAIGGMVTGAIGFLISAGMILIGIIINLVK